MLPCICCGNNVLYHDIEDKLVERGPEHQKWCDFYARPRCEQCDCSVYEGEGDEWHEATGLCAECYYEEEGE